MGNAFAGGGAVAEDASSVWFNPASMTRLPDQAQVGAHLIEPTFEFSDSGSTQAGSPAALLAGTRATDDGGERAVVPNLYYVRNLIEDRLYFGLALNVPFGLATKYPSDWKGRYHAIESEIRTFNLNPSLAWRFNDWLSIGAGVSAQYIDAKLTSAIDFTAVCASTGTGLEGQLSLPAGTLSSTCTGIARGPGQGGNDGHTENKADDISFGYNVGVMVEPDQRTRLTVGYRSEVNHELDGKVRFDVPARIATNATLDAAVRRAFADGGISVAADLPQQVAVSAYHRFHERWAIMGDATWTDWSSIPELRIVYDNPTTTGDGVAIENLQWDSAWRLSAGLQHYYNDRVTLRAGFAWDQSPVHDPTLRTPRLPDNDRWWIALGGSFELVPRKVSLDVGYARLEIPDTVIARSNDTRATLNGTYSSHSDILSAQLSWRFD